MSVHLHLRLDENTVSVLDRLAEIDGRTRSNFIRKLIRLAGRKVEQRARTEEKRPKREAQS